MRAVNIAFRAVVNIGFIVLCIAFVLLVLAFRVGLIFDPKIWGQALLWNQ